MSQIDEIKSRIDIVDLVSEAGVKLRRSGKNYTGFCPFHSNVHTPAFVVWPETGTWRCFGQCNEGGDIFKFMMKKEGWDFPEALRRLAERAGVTLRPVTPQEEKAKEEHARLRELLEDAATFYRHHLLNTAEGKSALDYLLQKRSLTPQTLETFGLGYAPNSWDAALKHFTAKGYSEKELIDTGLLTVREAERDTGTPEHRKTYDRFRHRIMIPIRDENGKMAGFGARILDPNDVPKFLNSPETPVFSKGRLLYGLDRARKPIRTADQAVLVEGYLDVIALHQAGFENVISPMGTALTEDQLRLLKKFTRRIVLALDPDAAGQKAVLRGLEAARQSLDRQQEIAFDVRGLLRHEARLQADLRVASMPEGLDPDELVQRNPEEWKRLIAEAQPIVIHVMGALAAGRDLEDAKVKSDIAAQVEPLIEDLPDPIERDTYRQRLARFLKVDERALMRAPARGARARRPRQGQGEARAAETQPVAAPSTSPSHKLESHCLSILLRQPALLYRLDRSLQESDLGRLANDDFGYTDHQTILCLVRQSLEQDDSEPGEFLLAHLPPALESLAGELLTQSEQLDMLDDRLLEDLARGVIKLRRRAMSESLDQLRFLQEEAQQKGDLRAASYREMVLQYTRQLLNLNQAVRKLEMRRQE